MKELVLFYSYSGHTKQAAQKFGQDNKCDICEVSDEKRPNKFAAYTAGCFKAIKGGERKINPLTVNGKAVKFEDYSVINVFCPVWANNPPASMNSALKILPSKTKIKLFMVSRSGKSGKDSLSKRLSDAGFEIIGYEDIKS